MDSEGQRNQKSPTVDEEGTVPSSAPISPRYSGTRRVSFADPVVPGTLEVETETESETKPEAEDDDDVTVEDLREKVHMYRATRQDVTQDRKWGETMQQPI